MSQSDTKPKRKIEIVAHRGGIGPYEENTIGAFNHAFETGIDFMEMDIRLDHFRNRFYLEHDLLHLPRKRQNTLESVLPNLAKGTRTMVELKSFAWLTKSFAQRFLQDYDRYFDAQKTVVISFNPFVLMQLRKLRPDIQLGFLCRSHVTIVLFMSIYWRIMKPNYLLLQFKILYKYPIRFGKTHGMKIWSFVLNKRTQWHKAFISGVDGITTDFPQALSEFIKRY